MREDRKNEREKPSSNYYVYLVALGKKLKSVNIDQIIADIDQIIAKININ